MKKTKQFRPTAFILNAKMKVSLMLLLMLMLVPQRMWAWGGSGTSSSPYTIANRADLHKFANIVNGVGGETKNARACAKLTDDITNLGTWTPIGNNGVYTGTFDGQGHTISGISISASFNNTGFFALIDGATIKNFTLAGTVSSGYDNTGSVVGYAKGSSTIQDIVSTVNITMTATKSHLGGIAGNIENGTSVLGCTYSGTLNAGSSTDSNGGIVGFANANCSGTIKYCFFNGTVKTTGSGPQMGGILGYTNDESNNFGGVQNCYSCGTLTFNGNDDYANAIVGRIRAKSHTTINNTFLSGTATRAANTNCEEKVDFTKNKAITISVTADTGGKVSQSYVNPTTTTATQLQVAATPANGYHFTKWSDNGAQAHDVALTDNVNLTATFGTHTYGNWITDVAATCTTSGTKHHVCTFAGCDARENGTINALGHDYTSQTATATYQNTAATCTADAVYYHKCSRCNNKGTTTWTNTGSMLSHSMTEHAAHAATCTADGNLLYYICSRACCTGKYYKDNGAHTTNAYANLAATKNGTALGHDYTVESENVAYRAFAATCTTDAVYYHKCSRCDSKGSTTWTKTGSALGHDINDNQCSRCDLKAKAVYDNGTLTFYFDAKVHEGKTYLLNTDFNNPGWNDDHKYYDITSVVFDPSFAAARPTSCFRWFEDCTILTSISGLEYLNTEEITNMNYMFYDCKKLQELSIGNFDMKKVMTYSSMFYNCDALNTLTLKSLPFLKDGTFNTQFSGDGKTVNLVLDESSLIYEGTNYLPTITNCNHYNQTTPVCVDATCTSEGYDAKLCSYCNNEFDKVIIPVSDHHWDENSVCTICHHKADIAHSGTSETCTWTIYEDGFMLVKPTTGEIGDLGFWDSYAKVPWDAYRSEITSVKFQGTVVAQTCGAMFNNCSNLKSIDFGDFVTDPVTNMSYMFYSCTALRELDLSSFNTLNVNDYALMFNDCPNLATLKLSTDFYLMDGCRTASMFRNCGNSKNKCKVYYVLDSSIKNVFIYGGSLGTNLQFVESAIVKDGTTFINMDYHNIPAENVVFTRTFTPEKPATAMLPFQVGANQISGATFYEFKGVKYENGEWVATMQDVSTVAAYKPYVVIREGAGDITFGTGSQTVSFPVTPAASSMTTTDPETGWTFVALNETKTWEEGDPELGRAFLVTEENNTNADDNGSLNIELVKIEAGTTLKAGRCYFLMNEMPTIKGDVNNDGRVSIADLTLLIEILNGRAIDTTGNADVDGKNGVTTDDVEILRNIILSTQSSDAPDADGESSEQE